MLAHPCTHSKIVHAVARFLIQNSKWSVSHLHRGHELRQDYKNVSDDHHSSVLVRSASIRGLANDG